MDEVKRFLAEIGKVDLPEWNEQGPNIVPGRTVLTPGIYNGEPYDKAYLGQVLANNRRLKKNCNFDPAWVTGHNAEARYFARQTQGYWVNFRGGGTGIVADLEVLDQWDWEAIRQKRLRYLSVEISPDTTDSSTAEVIGPSIRAIANVDVGAVRGAALFGDGAAPVNLSDFPELASVAGEDSASGQPGQIARGTKMMDWLKGKLGLAPDVDDAEARKALEQRLQDGGGNVATAGGVQAPALQDGGGNDATAGGVQAPALQVLQDRVTEQDKEIARLNAAEGARLREEHGRRVTSGLAALRDSGCLPPAVYDRLAPVLSAIDPGGVVKLGEGAEAKDVGLAEAIVAALGDLPQIAGGRTVPGAAKMVDKVRAASDGMAAAANKAGKA